jgi:hypothetical protein
MPILQNILQTVAQYGTMLLRNRYEKKLQVSSCEKFGYGVLVSQLSTTRPGMQALYVTGLIKSFLSSLTTALEGDPLFGEACKSCYA